MAKQVSCSNCNSNNSEFEFQCTNCKYVLRDRVVNIDLWKFIAKIIESPGEGFRNIILAENKNFAFSILIFVALKVVINAIFFNIYITHALFRFYFIPIGVIAVITTVYLFSLMLKLWKRIRKQRYKSGNIFAVLTYSMMPYLFSLFFLLVLEFTVFGIHTFSISPSPYEIKKGFFYLFCALESVLILWSIFLSTRGLRYFTSSYIFAIATSVTFHIFIHLVLFIPLFYLPK